MSAIRIAAPLVPIRITPLDAPATVRLVVPETAPRTLRLVAMGVPGQRGPDPRADQVQVIEGSGAIEINWSLGEWVRLTLTGDAILSVTNWPATGYLGRVLVELVNPAAWTFAFPVGTLWEEGQAPEIPSNSTGLYLLSTTTGGETVFGNTIGRNYLPPGG